MRNDNVFTMIIKQIQRRDELRELVSVCSVAFESEYIVTDEYLETMLDNSDCLILGALADERVVGGLIAFELLPIHGEREMYLYDIAVHPQYQRHGIGKRLMQQLKKEAKIRGVKTIFVEAESEDVGAVAFYRSIGGEEVGVHHFNININ